MKIKRVSTWFLTALVALVLVGCDSIPEATRKSAEAVPGAIKSAETILLKQTNAHESVKSGEDWSFLSSYADTENWSDSFKQAQSEIDRAKKLVDSSIIPLMKDNESASENKLISAIGKAKSHLKTAKENGEEPASRAMFLISARNNAPDQIAQAATEMKQIEVLVEATQVVADKAKTDYAQKTEDIDGRMAAYRKISADAKDALVNAQAQFGMVESVQANYAIMADSISLVGSKLAAAIAMEEQLVSKFGELYRSYSKTLTEAKIEYYVEIGRTSWDNSSDWNTEKEFKYSREVDEATFNYFDSVTAEVIATRSTGWGGNESIAVDATKWKVLKINMSESWPRNHSASEFWMSNTFTKTYHKYTIVENGEKSETGWEKVSEDSYWTHEGHKGMTLVSKPYGMYEDEIIREAMPPGMEHIAKPEMVDGVAQGNNQYGEWRQDSSGNSFWHYYGQYALMRDLMWGPSYYYNDYNHYSNRTRGSAYYGNPNSQNSAMKTRSVSKASPARSGSVRTAGATSRGRGPGGGGK